MDLYTAACIHETVKHDRALMQHMYQRYSVGTKGEGSLVVRGVRNAHWHGLCPACSMVGWSFPAGAMRAALWGAESMCSPQGDCCLCSDEVSWMYCNLVLAEKWPDIEKPGHLGISFLLILLKCTNCESHSHISHMALQVAVLQSGHISWLDSQALEASTAICGCNTLIFMYSFETPRRWYL